MGIGICSTLDEGENNVLMGLAKTHHPISGGNGTNHRLVRIENTEIMQPFRINIETGKALVIVKELLLWNQPADKKCFAIFCQAAKEPGCCPSEIAMPVAYVTALPIQPAGNFSFIYIKKKIAGAVVTVQDTGVIQHRHIVLQPVSHRLHQRHIFTAILFPDSPCTVELPQGSLGTAFFGLIKRAQIRITPVVSVNGCKMARKLRP